MVRLLNKETVSATIVTTKRAYYLMISPAQMDSVWHTGVKWVYEDSPSSSGGFGYRASPETSISSSSLPHGAVAPSFDPYDGIKGHPNFEYAFDAQHALAPAAVWDNGRFTWIQLKSTAQSVPAVFYIGPDGPEVVNFTVLPGGKQILVNRLMGKFMLRLGNEFVVVSARNG